MSQQLQYSEEEQEEIERIAREEYFECDKENLTEQMRQFYAFSYDPDEEEEKIKEELLPNFWTMVPQEDQEAFRQSAMEVMDRKKYEEYCENMGIDYDSNMPVEEMRKVLLILQQTEGM